MKKTAIVLAALTLTIVVGAIAFCGCVEKKPEAKLEEIKVGAILPLTGDLAVYGENIKKGIDLAVEEINNKGGINGTNITALYKDNEGKRDKTVSAMNELAGEVPVVIGAAVSANTLAVCPIAEEKKIVLISPTSTSPILSDYKNYVFRTVGSDVHQGSVLSDVVSGLKPERTILYKKVAVLYVDNEYGIGLKNEFEKRYMEEVSRYVEQPASLIVATESFKEGDSEFKAMLTKIKEKEPDVIVLIGYVKEGAAIVKQAKEVGLNVTWLGSDGIKSDAFIEHAGINAEGIIATYPISMVSEPVTENFVELYEAKYGSGHIDSFAAYGYDTMMVVGEAIENGGYSADGIKDALHKIRYHGVCGMKIFDENGDVPAGYDLWKVENSEWVVEAKL